MTNHAHIAAHCNRRIRLLDADDVAAQLLAQAREGPRRMALFLKPDGEFLAATYVSDRYLDFAARFPGSLVGVYSGDAMKCDVVEDIRVRAEMIGMEWAEAKEGV